MNGALASLARRRAISVLPTPVGPMRAEIHEDVLGVDLGAHRAFYLGAAPAVAQRNGDSTLGAGLADDVGVQLGDDLARRHHAGAGRGGHSKLSSVSEWLV
jgi:hypothetical protein